MNTEIPGVEEQLDEAVRKSKEAEGTKGGDDQRPDHLSSDTTGAETLTD